MSFSFYVCKVKERQFNPQKYSRTFKAIKLVNNIRYISKYNQVTKLRPIQKRDI